MLDNEPFDNAPPPGSTDLIEAPIAPVPEAVAEAAPDPAPPEGAPWDALDLVFTLMAVIGSLFLAEILGLVTLAVVGAARAGSAFQASELFKQYGTSAPFQMLVQFVSYALVMMFVFLTAQVKYHRSLGSALQWKSMGPNTWMFLPAGMAVAIVSMLTQAIMPTEKHFPIEKLFKDPVSGYTLALFGVLVAPIVEETLFRGMLYPVLERRWGLEVAVLGSSLVFASIHAPQLAGGIPQLAVIFMVGVLLGYVRGRTGSLVPGWLIHTGYNATLFSAVCVATKGFTKFPT